MDLVINMIKMTFEWQSSTQYIGAYDIIFDENDGMGSCQKVWLKSESKQGDQVIRHDQIPWSQLRIALFSSFSSTFITFEKKPWNMIVTLQEVTSKWLLHSVLHATKTRNWKACITIMASDTTNQVEVWPHLHVLGLTLQSSLFWTKWKKKQVNKKSHSYIIPLGSGNQTRLTFSIKTKRYEVKMENQETNRGLLAELLLVLRQLDNLV